MKHNVTTKFRELFWKLRGKIEPHLARIRLLSSTLGLGLTLITSNLLQLAIADPGWNQEATSFLKAGLIVIASAFVLQILWILADMLFGKPVRMHAPPNANREEHFTASPYASNWRAPTDMELSRVGSLTGVAAEEFDNDTLPKAVVLNAVKKSCAMGLKLRDAGGKDVGFIDLYHLSPQAHRKWVEGFMFERDIKKTDFIPISRITDSGARTINLMVGGILLCHPNPLYNFYLAPLMVAAFRAYASTALKDFDQVNLYATIYTRAGLRYAQLFGFRQHLSPEQRGPASGGHAVYEASFDPHDPSGDFFASTKHTVFRLSLSV